MDNLPFELGTYYEDIVRFLPALISAMVIFFVGLYLSSLISRAVRKVMQRRGTNPQVTLLVGKIIYWTFLILMTATALQQVGFNLTAFLAGLGIVGFTIGFALQDVSKNFVSGLLLLIQQPFNIGESVKVGDFSGVVMAVDLRATQIVTFDGMVVLIPNADVFTKPIINYTRGLHRRIEIQIGVAHESELEQVRKTALAAIHKVPGLLAEPAPQLSYHTYGASSIDFSLYYWIDTKKVDLLTAKDQGLCALKEAFDAAQIKIPTPLQVVRIEQ